MKDSWYKMYASRWIVSQAVMELNMIQKGVFITALNYSFVKGGLITKKMVMNLKQEASEDDVDEVLKQFTLGPNKAYFHPLILEQVEYINSLSEAGSKGNLKRWHPEEYKELYDEGNDDSDRGAINEANPDKIREDKIREERKTLCDSVIENFNQIFGKRVKVIPARMKQINARSKEGYDLEDFIYVMKIKKLEWQGNEMKRHLTPETLFGTKFSKYREQEMPTAREKLVR